MSTYLHFLFVKIETFELESRIQSLIDRHNPIYIGNKSVVSKIYSQLDTTCKVLD